MCVTCHIKINVEFLPVNFVFAVCLGIKTHPRKRSKYIYHICHFFTTSYFMSYLTLRKLLKYLKYIPCIFECLPSLHTEPQSTVVRGQSAMSRIEWFVYKRKRSKNNYTGFFNFFNKLNLIYLNLKQNCDWANWNREQLFMKTKSIRRVGSYNVVSKRILDWIWVFNDQGHIDDNSQNVLHTVYKAISSICYFVLLQLQTISPRLGFAKTQLGKDTFTNNTVIQKLF